MANNLSFLSLWVKLLHVISNRLGNFKMAQSFFSSVFWGDLTSRGLFCHNRFGPFWGPSRMIIFYEENYQWFEANFSNQFDMQIPHPHEFTDSLTSLLDNTDESSFLYTLIGGELSTSKGYEKSWNYGRGIHKIRHFACQRDFFVCFEDVFQFI